jgi:hypothetical protein
MKRIWILTSITVLLLVSCNKQWLNSYYVSTFDSSSYFTTKSTLKPIGYLGNLFVVHGIDTVNNISFSYLLLCPKPNDEDKNIQKLIKEKSLKLNLSHRCYLYKKDVEYLLVALKDIKSKVTNMNNEDKLIYNTYIIENNNTINKKNKMSISFSVEKNEYKLLLTVFTQNDKIILNEYYDLEDIEIIEKNFSEYMKYLY